MLSYQIYQRWSHAVPGQLKRRGYKKWLSTEHQINAKIPMAPSYISPLAPHLLSRFQMAQWWETRCALWRTQLFNLSNIPAGWVSLLWLYILIVFLIFILAQFPLQALEIFPINIWVFFFFVNIPFRLFLQMTSLTVIFTKAVYFKRFFQGKFDFKFIIPVNWNYTRKLSTIAVMQIGSRSSTTQSVCW